MLPRPSGSRSGALTASASAGAPITTPRPPCHRAHRTAAGFLRRRHYRVADAMRAARGETAHAVRPGVGIGGVDIDVLYRHAECLRADLPGYRLHALTEIDRGQ